MSKAKLFIENILIFGLGGIISKAIPLIMVPIITAIMPTTDYFGLSDMSNTVVSFGSAFAVLGMYDAMYRLFFEKDDEEFKKNVCSTTLCFTMVMSAVVFLVMILIRTVIAKIFFEDVQYSYLVYLSATAALVTATNNIIAAPTRMQNKRKVFIIANTVSPLISYGISIPLLLAGYYVIALPLAVIISGVTLEATFYILNRKWFEFKRFDKKLLKELLVIALPLFPNFLVYWLFNSSDKVMITNMIGLGAQGIYAAGSKLGHASHLIYTAFAGGWQFFAFSTMNEKDQVKSNSLIFEYLGVISFSATFFVCALAKLIFMLLPGSYMEGCIIAPYLFLAPLLQMLFQVISNQFLVVKKTWPNLFILSFGALMNIVLNRLLIPMIGIEGAAIATLCGYIISDVICVIVLCRMKLMVVGKRFIAAVAITAGYFVLWRFLLNGRTVLSTLAAAAATALLCLLYMAEIKIVVAKLKEKLGRKKAEA